MAKYRVSYVVEASSLSEVVGQFAYPDGEPRTDEVTEVEFAEWFD